MAVMPPELAQDPAAALALIRSHLARQRRQEARSLAHLLRDDAATAEIGTLCSAVVATAEGFFPLARALFAQVSDALALKHASNELISVLCEDDDIAAGLKVCRRFLELYAPPTARDASRLLMAASTALELDRRNEARALWEVVCVLLWGSAEEQRRLDEAHAVVGLFETRNRSRSVERHSHGVRLAIVDQASPAAWSHPADTELLVFLDQLARRPNTMLVDTANAQGLCDFVASLGSPRPSANRARIAVDTLDAFSDVTDEWLASTWVVAHGARIDADFVRRLPALMRSERCIVLSMELADARALTADLRAWLQRCGPVGCRTWSTVLLLRQAGVQAFFAGSLLAMAGSLIEPLRAWLSGGVEVVGASRSAADPWRTRLERAARQLLASADDTAHRTNSVDRYLPALAVGRPVRFAPKGDGRLQLEGLVDLAEADLRAMQARFAARLDAVLKPIVGGQSAEDVMAAWRGACRQDLLEADRYCRAYGPLPTISLDVGRIVADVRATSTERSPEPQAPAARIELAFSIDSNLQSQLPVVLESIIDNASRSIRSHILMRGLDAAYVAALERNFGADMGLAFYDCSVVHYGSRLRMLSHTTVSTLDRLLLPELFAHLDKVIYLDADLVVRADLAELWTVDLRGQRLAAKSSSSPRAQYVHQMVDHALASLSPSEASDARRRLYDQNPLLCRAFNAGVLVMNLARMRDEDFTQRFIPMIENYGMNDQDVLNVYAGAERVELDPDWNAIPRQDLTDKAKIVHFAGPVKPWSDLYVGRACDFKFYEARYLARTRRSG